VNRTSRTRAKESRAWLWFLLAGGAAIVVSRAVTGVAGSLLFCSIGAASTAAILYGVRRHRPATRLVWILFAFGNAILFVGDVVWRFDHHHGGSGFPTLADLFYLIAYPFLGGAALWICKPRSRKRLRSNVLDSIILGIQAFVVLWVFVIDRYYETAHSSVVEGTVAGVYVFAAVAVGALAAGIVMFVKRRAPAHWLLFAAFLTLVPADIAHIFAATAAGFERGTLIEMAWLLSYVLFGVAALHPSMTRVADATPSDPARLTWRRLTFYAAAALTVPISFAAEYALTGHVDWVLVIFSALGLWIALLARLSDVVRALTAAVDERDEAAESLKRSEGRWSSIVTNSTDMIFLLDETTTVEWVSPVVEDILGYTAEEFSGIDIFSLIHLDDYDEFATVYAEVALGMEPRSSEFRIRHKDGHWRWLETRGISLLSDPNVEAVVLSARNITARREAEDALRASEERFRELAETVSEVFYIHSTDGRLLYVSPAYESVWGRSRTSLYEDNLSWQDAIHPDDRPGVEEAWTSLGLSETIEFRIVRDGEVRWIRDRTFPIRDAEGQIVRVLGVSEDITERKFAEQALVDREELERAVLDSLSAHIAVVEGDGTIIAVNQAWEDFSYVLGGDDDGPTGVGTNLVDALKRSLERHPSFERAMALEGLETVLEGRREEFTIEYSTGTGEQQRWFSMQVSPLRNAAGGAVVSHLDVSEQKKALHDQERLTEQLRQSQKLEAIGRLAGGVAHDFNNILAVIQNYAWFLVEDMDDQDPKRQDVQEIVSAGDRAAKLVQQLLTFSRKEIVKPELLDINEVIADYGKFLTRAIGEDVSLELHLQPKVAPVLLDSSHVGQILTNLAVNARDAMASGGRLTIETSQAQIAGSDVDLSPGNYILLRVADTGCGMTPDVVARVFEPFFTTKARGEGTGLGLATVYGIVNQAGGHIQIDSIPDQGTTFSIYLPAVPDLMVEVEDEREEAEVIKGNETILVVEDEEAVGRMVERILLQHGYKVLTAPSGEEALRIAAEPSLHIDVLLTDVVMPGMSGKTLAEEMLKARPDTRVIFMSGYTDEIITRRGRLEQGEMLIEKPFNPEELVRAIRQVLEASSRV
jgi:PAS domain S-box-containing protein